MAPESSVNLAGGSVADETKPSLKIRPLRGEEAMEEVMGSDVLVDGVGGHGGVGIASMNGEGIGVKSRILILKPGLKVLLRKLWGH